MQVLKLIRLLSLSLFLTSGGCGFLEGDQDVLRQRAEQWSSLLSNLDSKEEQEAIKAIQQYIEPSSGRALRASEYRRNFTTGATKVVANSVDEVIIEPKGATAVVRYTTVNRLPNGELRTGSQSTKWKKVDGTWYRIIQEAEVIINQ